ncbi:MAG TPA: hypothetical protein PLU71_02250 [Candidatus Dependentiae bacterium]|nr:hypothetical protein [Candidatus Dependentiae bacterium]HRQ62652.1 hypothetical protein [Candidatus Dependentiae bacterium]
MKLIRSIVILSFATSSIIAMEKTPRLENILTEANQLLHQLQEFRDIKNIKPINKLLTQAQPLIDQEKNPTFKQLYQAKLNYIQESINAFELHRSSSQKLQISDEGYDEIRSSQELPVPNMDNSDIEQATMAVISTVVKDKKTKKGCCIL